MSNANKIENTGEAFSSSSPEHPQYIEAEFVESSPFDSQSTPHRTNAEDEELMYIPWHEEFTEEYLQATDTITFDRVFTKRARPHRQPQKSALEQLLTPWGVSAVACFVLANGLLIWSQISPPTPVNTAAIAPQVLPNPELNSLNPINPAQFNIAAPAAQAHLTPETLSKLPSDSVKNHPVVANLPPIPTTVAPQAIAPSQVTVPPEVSNSLANAMLPPSLQLQYPPAYAPVAVPTVNPTSYAKVNPIPTRPVISNLQPVNPPQRSLPTIAVNPAYSAPRSLSNIPLPPPPPPPTAFVQPPAAPTVTAPTSPPAIANPVPSSTSPIAEIPQTNTNNIQSLSDQMARQIANQQNQLQTQTVNPNQESFNYKTRKKLQTLYNQSQGVSTNSDVSATETTNLIQELQRLNQPE
ncbi:MAG: hypothetical protein VKJ02_02465 [Snowella sp.]|nr:hypothetical protein [Snowella sp.]